MAHKTKRARVASALNRITEQSFVDAMSTSDREAMSDFVGKFFCGDLETDESDNEEEEEPG